MARIVSTLALALLLSTAALSSAHADVLSDAAPPDAATVSDAGSTTPARSGGCSAQTGARAGSTTLALGFVAGAIYAIARRRRG